MSNDQVQNVINLYKKYLTVEQILAKTPTKRREMAQHTRLSNIVIKGPDKINHKRLRRIEAVARTMRNNDGTARTNPPAYKVIALGLDNNYRMYQGPIQIACSCADTKFRWDYVLNKKKAAAVRYSNGKPPLIRNPTFLPATCVGENTLIATNKGNIPIKDIKVGDVAYTELGWKNITEHILTKENSKTLKITSASGQCIECTEDHPIFVIREYQLRKLMAKDVNTNDYLIINTSESIYEICNSLYNEKYILPITNEYNKNGLLLLNPNIVLLNTIEKINDNISFSKIVKIEEGAIQNVYDICVEEAHHYYANSVLVHNCKHSTALLNYIIKEKL